VLQGRLNLAASIDGCRHLSADHSRSRSPHPSVAAAVDCRLQTASSRFECIASVDFELRWGFEVSVEMAEGWTQTYGAHRDDPVSYVLVTLSDRSPLSRNRRGP